VSSGPLFFLACVFGTVSMGFLLCAALAVGLVCEMIDGNPIAACFAIALLLVTLLTTVGAAVATLQAAFPRQWEFQRDSRTCVLRNVPGFSRQLPFDQILYIDLLTTRNQAGGWVALSLRHSRRPFVVCGIKTLHEQRESVFAALAAVADEVSCMTGRSVRRRVVSGSFAYVVRWW